MRPRNWMLGAFVALLAASAFAAFVQLPVYPKKVYESDSRWFSSPGPASDAQRDALTDFVVLGSPLPIGFQQTSLGGKVTGLITGSMPGPPAEFSISVTVIDESADIETAMLKLGDQVLFTATRVNGAVVDRSGNAIATLTALVPQVAPFSVTLVWVGLDGQSNEESLTF